MYDNEIQSRAAAQKHMSGAYLGSAQPAPPVSDKPLMEVEYDQLEQATLELDQSVQFLLQRIHPICQPCAMTKAAEGASSREPDAPSSEMRMKLKNLRGLVERISSRIAEVRYTIEV